MNSLNSILLEGNLVRDPESKTLSAGSQVCNFCLASDRFYKQADSTEKEVSYFDVEAWSKLGLTCSQNLRKGRGVRVVGRLKNPLSIYKLLIILYNKRDRGGNAMFAFYCRVSTDSQEKANTIEGQIELAKTYIKENEITEYAFYKDDGISAAGEDIAKRPALLSLLDDVKSKKITDVWVSNLDRLSRNQYVYAVVSHEFNKHKINLYVKNKIVDMNNPTDKFMADILISVASYEKELIKLRTSFGRARLKNQGLYPKSCLYGYKTVGKSEITGRAVIEPVKDELENMKLLFTKVLEGHTVHSIGRKYFNFTYSGQWSARLHYPEYAGYTPNTNGELIPSKIYMPIISLDDWKKVQEIIAVNSERVKKNLRKANHLGSGLLICYYCGIRYHYTSNINNSGKKYYYYRQMALSLRKCPERFNAIPKRKLDEIIDFTFMIHLGLRENIFHELTFINANSEEADKSKYAFIKKQLAVEEKTLSNITNAIIKGLDASLFIEQAKKTKVAIEQYKKQLEEIEQSQERVIQDLEKQKELILSDKYRNYFLSEPEKKRELFLDIFAGGKVKGDCIVISTHINRHYIFSKKGLPNDLIGFNTFLQGNMLNKQGKYLLEKYLSYCIPKQVGYAGIVDVAKKEGATSKLGEILDMLDYKPNYNFWVYDFREGKR